jgi:hypothetical protein
MLSVQCKFHGNRGLGARRRTRISALGTCNGWLATSHPGLRPAGHSTGKLPCKFSSSPPVLSPSPAEPLLCSVHTTQTAGRFRRETRQSQTPSCQLSTLVGFGSRLSSSRWPAAAAVLRQPRDRACSIDLHSMARLAPLLVAVFAASCGGVLLLGAPSAASGAPVVYVVGDDARRWAATPPTRSAGGP